MPPDLQFTPIEEPRRVLLVEDDVVLRGLLAEAMRDEGMVVVEAANADEAQHFLMAGNGISLVFSDVEMPGSMNGIGLARWMRQNYPDIALILTSGSAQNVPAELGTFIPKPYNLLQAAEIARDFAERMQGDG